MEALAKKFNDTKRVENLKEVLEKRLKKIAEKHRADRDKMQRMAYYDPDINIPMNRWVIQIFPDEWTVVWPTYQ